MVAGCTQCHWPFHEHFKQGVQAGCLQGAGTPVGTGCCGAYLAEEETPGEFGCSTAAQIGGERQQHGAELGQDLLGHLRETQHTAQQLHLQEGGQISKPGSDSGHYYILKERLEDAALCFQYHF